jgi:hypothetical protein
LEHSILLYLRWCPSSETWFHAEFSICTRILYIVILCMSYNTNPFPLLTISTCCNLSVVSSIKILMPTIKLYFDHIASMVAIFDPC